MSTTHAYRGGNPLVTIDRHRKTGQVDSIFGQCNAIIAMAWLHVSIEIDPELSLPSIMFPGDYQGAIRVSHRCGRSPLVSDLALLPTAQQHGLVVAADNAMRVQASL